ncbi:cytochrome P450 7A1 isoform X2 [Siphateles boraxobius]|uniref:cytochrome P450 7A1 isoform X2 n=1 Tax=Siphateles boraxobius TaxID=180520 RepID=UPI004062C32A
MSSCLVVVPAILLTLLIVWICGHSRRRRPGEPPLVSGWIPVIGVTLDYATNPLGFLRETQKKYGDVFTCAIAGKYFTFVTDPFSFSTVVRQSRKLDFKKFSLGFSRRVFGHADFNDPQFSESYREVHGLFRQTLQGPSLQDLGESMMFNLQTTVLDRENGSMLCNPQTVLDRENGSMLCNPQTVLDRENGSMLCNPQTVLDRENESMLCNTQTVLDRENESMLCNPQTVLDRENGSMLCNPQTVLDRENGSMLCNPQTVLDRENGSMLCNPQTVLDRENESMLCNTQAVLDRENESMLCNTQTVLDRENESMLYNPQTVLDQENGSEHQWLEEGLQSFTNRIMFEAGFLTLFGKDPGFLQTSKTRMREFLAFDHAFPLLAAGVPIGLIPRVWRAREALAEELVHDELHQRKCISDLIHRRMEAFDRMHLDETGKARTHVCMLWASQANTLPAAFWSLYYTLRSPDALTAARTEINSVLSGQVLNNQDQRIELSREQLDSMTVLESIIEEALRLSSASMMIRVANEDFTLTLDSGQTADIRRGDHVALYPQLIHMDPEIYPNPTEFRFGRFLDENGQRKTHFFRNGRRLKHFLMPFGSGASECPGRFFALHEIKQFLAVTLWRYDLHLCDAGVQLDPDARRAGLGVLPPSRDVPLRYRRRTHTKHEENTHQIGEHLTGGV